MANEKAETFIWIYINDQPTEYLVYKRESTFERDLLLVLGMKTDATYS